MKTLQTVPSTKTRAKRGSTRRNMLISAAEVMRERGAAGVTIDEVLARSGAPRGSVYYHFPEGRNQILAEALRWAGDTIAESIDAAAERGALPLVRGFIQFWERTLQESDFGAGCPSSPPRSVAQATKPSWPPSRATSSDAGAMR